VKKNMLLVVVLALSLSAAAFLVYKAIVATSDMNKYMADVEKLKHEIQAKNAQDIIPTDENLNMIAKDKDAVAAKRRELELIFGNPYRKAVERMAASLGMSADELRKRWKDIYLQEVDKGNPREMIFAKFFEEVGREKEKRAISAFRNALRGSAESLSDANIKGCVMEALGVPRMVPPMVCKQFLCQTIKRIAPPPPTSKDQKSAKEEGAKPSGNPSLFIFGTGKDDKTNTVRFLTFDKYHGDSLPRPEEVPYIFKHIKLLEDMVGRMKKAGLEGLLDISKESVMGRTVNDNYLIFTYTVKVEGKLDAVRAFANSLMEAYKDNRVYVIRSVALDEDDEAGKIFNKTGGGTGASRRSDRSPATPDFSSELGLVLIGSSDVVMAEITLDYVIFTGNELVSEGGK